MSFYILFHYYKKCQIKIYFKYLFFAFRISHFLNIKTILGKISNLVMSNTPVTFSTSSITKNNVHPVELSVYSVLSSNLDGLQQSINELRESQAILIILLRKQKQLITDELEILYDKEQFKQWGKQIKSIEKRIKLLTKRYNKVNESLQSYLNQKNPQNK